MQSFENYLSIGEIGDGRFLIRNNFGIAYDAYLKSIMGDPFLKKKMLDP